tara:strand:+ start:11854 stop:12603 length:750 start_codon:yes stop_codon:yes gene_type:complete
MNYYSKHIGDFNNKTRHLSRIERSLFSDAIELYYSTERPLISDINKLSRLLLANTEEEKDALKIILDEFFTLKKGVYRNKRCDEELAIYNSKCKHNQRVGKLGGRPKKDHSKDKSQKPSGFPNITQVVSKNNPTQEPVPILIKKEIHKEKSVTPLARLVSLNINSQIAKDWLQLRNSLKAPVTATVIQSFQKEADKSKMTLEEVFKICIENSWRGFKAEWLHCKPDKFDGLAFVNQGRTENLHEKLIEN